MQRSRLLSNLSITLVSGYLGKSNEQLKCLTSSIARKNGSINHSNYTNGQVRSMIVYYHSSSVYMKGKGRSSSANDISSASVANVPDLIEFENQMNRGIARLTELFDKLRVGKARSDMFDNLYFESEQKTKVKVGDVGQIFLESPFRIKIALYDPLLGNSVVNAIKSSGYSLSPTIDGNNVLINIPKPSKESRNELVKEAAKVSEQQKVVIRNIRKVGMDKIKKIEKNLSVDDSKRFIKNLENLTNKKLEVIVKMNKDKDKELMAE